MILSPSAIAHQNIEKSPKNFVTKKDDFILKNL